MIKIVIDDREIEVAPGTKVIEAAEKLGIMIPRFCYHPALGSVGACRVCAVKFLQGPFKGVQMSCMIDAQDGMVVSTNDPEAVRFRKYVIEWLMLNHPHDCPVCDEGGHCLLQDMTVSGGHGMRRYKGKKRTYTDQYLGPLLQHEMNRCIHCYRCARYYQEFSGYRDLGVMKSANQTYFGRFEDGVLENPFSGNLSDICPTGVYTDKPSRFFGRRWDYRRTPSVCINCSLGCHTTASSRFREVRRLEARLSPAVNGHFICDRGRYGFFYCGYESRPRQARVDGQEAPVRQARSTASERLDEIGASVTAFVGSARSSLETLIALKNFCLEKSMRQPTFLMPPALQQEVHAAVSRLEPDLMISLGEVETADLIFAFGADALNEAPMLALAMRQAQRAGAEVFVFDPRPVSLPFEFHHVPVTPDAVGGILAGLIKDTIRPDAAAGLGSAGEEFIAQISANGPGDFSSDINYSKAAQAVAHCQKPVVICGTDIVPAGVSALAADYTLVLKAMDKKAGLFYLLPGANAFGIGLLFEPDESFEQTIEGIENGSIKALVLVESDPFEFYADRKRLESALEKLELLVVMDYIDSAAVEKAHILLPTTTLYEAGGIFINQEARAQAALPAYSGGTPIAQTGAGDHPPRQYGTGIPGSEAIPAWVILSEWSVRPEWSPRSIAHKNDRAWMADAAAEFADLQTLDDLPDEGLRLQSAADKDLRFNSAKLTADMSPESRVGRLELILVDWTFGTEPLSAYADCLQELAPEPCATISAADATDLNLNNGDRINIETDNGSLELTLRVADNMASGCLLIPRHWKINWQLFGTDRMMIGKDGLKKVG